VVHRPDHAEHGEREEDRAEDHQEVAHASEYPAEEVNGALKEAQKP
jgi:hypothetical protein